MAYFNSARVRAFMLRSVTATMLVGALLVPSTAQAWWHRGGGFFFGPPIIVGPPIYIGPPVYVGPPVYAAPPAYYGGGPAGQACYAGPYICPLDAPGPRGAPCSCPTNQNGRAGGRVG